MIKKLSNLLSTVNKVKVRITMMIGLEPCQVTHAEAFLCVNKLLTWLEKQDECNAYI